MSIIEGIIILVFLIVLPILFVSGNSSMTMVNYHKISKDKVEEFLTKDAFSI